MVNQYPHLYRCDCDLVKHLEHEIVFHTDRKPIYKAIVLNNNTKLTIKLIILIIIVSIWLKSTGLHHKTRMWLDFSRVGDTTSHLAQPEFCFGRSTTSLPSLFLLFLPCPLIYPFLLYHSLSSYAPIPKIQWGCVRDRGKACKLPGGSGGARPPNSFWCIFR